MNMTEHEFAAFGDGELAYIKAVKAEDVKKMFPQLSGLPEGIDLFAVHAADGTPLALTDTLVAAIGNAREHNLKPLSVH